MQILKKITHRRSSILLSFCCLLFFSAQITPREYQVKAVFLFNFAQFVEWPPQCFPTPESPAIIGILGENPFGTSLEETIAGEKINNHPLIVKHFNNVEDIDNCHILFINIHDKKTLESTLEKLKGKNILTMSDVDGFSKMGGIITFYNHNDKINIQVNLEAGTAANLTISSKLLKLSEIVKTDIK